MSTHALGRLKRMATTLTTVALAVSLTAATASAANAQELGIDVSRWQHNPSINWSSVKADGVDFAFIKATEGAGYINPHYAPDVAATKRVGIYRGAYHFARPSKTAGDAAAEARYFVNHAGKHQGLGDLPPVLDLEDSGGLGVAALRSWVATWLTTVKNATGRTPIIYVSPAFWEHYLGNSTAFTDYPLWVAHYGVSAPRVPGGWTRWTFWQGTSTGRVAGISGDVDMNAFYGTRRQLKRLANITVAEPTPAPEPEPTPEPAPEPETEAGPSAKVKTTATLNTMKQTIRKGRKVRLYGHLKTAAGKPVTDKTLRVYKKRPGTSTWRLVRKTASVAPTGWYQTYVAPRRTMVYKAVYRGNTRFAKDASNRVKVTVRR